MTQQELVANLGVIPFEPDLAGLYKRFHVKEGSENAHELHHLVEQARARARPRAFYRVAYITARGEGWVEIERRRFTSRVLAVNLKDTFRVFPYLATCGTELQEWAAEIEDLLLHFWAEGIKEAALACALEALHQHMAQYSSAKLSAMSPGSLQDWPIQQQQILFDLFGPAAEQTGVRLTDSMLMIPTKTVSGIRFAAQANFESCALCAREDCPGRRAAYDADLYESHYCLHNG